MTHEADTGRLDTLTYKVDSTGASFASFDLDYDKASNVTQKISDVFANGPDGTWTYQMDPASRMTKATLVPTTGSTTQYDYAYDGASNRTLAKQTVGTTVVQNWGTTYTATSLADVATNDPPGTANDETVTYVYDTAGVTLLSANSNKNANDWGYTYDAFSRLTCAKPAATTCTSGTARVQLSSDAFSRTHTRINAGTTTTSYYRGVGEDLVKSVGSATITYALTAGGSPLAQQVGSGKSFFLRDPHGDSVGLVRNTAANLGTSSYDPFGQVLSVSGTQSALGYQSDVTDPVTKQVDMGTRWYAPGQGRFSTRDVIFGDPLHPTTLNQWAYGGANPITMWDPTGMRFTFVEGGINGGCSGITCSQAFGDALIAGGSCSSCGSSGWSSVVIFPAPTRPEAGVVRGGAFIDSYTAGGGVGEFGLYFKGDAYERGSFGFRDDAPASGYRAFTRIDFRQGFGLLRVNHSCRLSFPQACNAARAFGVDGGANRFSSASDSASVSLNLRVGDSALRGAPFLDADITFTAGRGGLVDATFGPEGTDTYPSWEFYQRQGGGADPTPIAQVEATAGVSGLFHTGAERQQLVLLNQFVGWAWSG